MRNIIFFIAVMTGLLLFNSTSALASRPLKTEDAWTIKPGHVAFEGSYTQWEDDNGTRTSEYRSTFQIGLLKQFDLGLEIPYRNVHPEGSTLQDDFYDGLIVTKLRLFDETDETPAFTLRLDFKPHNGDEETGFGSGRNSYSLTGVMSRSDGRLAYHMNLGVAYRGVIEDTDETDYKTAVFYSFAVEYTATKTLTIAGEILGENVFGEDGPDVYTAAVGAKISVTEGTVFDFSITRGLSSNAPDNVYTGGITIYF